MIKHKTPAAMRFEKAYKASNISLKQVATGKMPKLSIIKKK